MNLLDAVNNRKYVNQRAFPQNWQQMQAIQAQQIQMMNAQRAQNNQLPSAIHPMRYLSDVLNPIGTIPNLIVPGAITGKILSPNNTYEKTIISGAEDAQRILGQ